MSGPSRPRTQTARRTPAAEPFALRAFTRVVALADSRLLRGLVHGRLWIPLVAAGLMGIVFMQVSMLKLNAGIGRAVQTASTLERRNAAMRADVSRMESSEKVDDVAHDLGMVIPADGGEYYVTAGHGAAARAVQRMTAPSPAATAATAAATQAAGATQTQTQTPAATQAPAQTQTPAQAAAATPAVTTPAVTPAQTSAPAPQQATSTPPPASQQPAATQVPPATTPPAQAAAAPSGGVAAPPAQGQG